MDRPPLGPDPLGGRAGGVVDSRAGVPLRLVPHPERFDGADAGGGGFCVGKQAAGGSAALQPLGGDGGQAGGDPSQRVEIHRLPGLHRIARNDVLVFHFPHPETWERIEMHLLKYYVKRCIALPGDTLLIRQGHYHIAGYDGALGNEAAQNRMERMGEADFSPEVYASFPYDSLLGWNIREFGPLYVPKAGDEIEMDRTHYVLYKKVIEWEQRGTLTYRDSTVYLNGRPLPRYRFEKDYYFMGGDKAENSQDSRYWGLLPEEYIVGKVWKIWKSVDPYTDEFRWERFMKEVK